MEVRVGYRKTELGVLPESWGIKNLGELTTLMTNGFVGVATSHYVNNQNGVLYIQGYNVEQNSFNFKGIKYVSEAFHKAHLKSSLREGDLLTVQTGNVGLTTVVTESLVGSNCHALIISRFDRKKAFPEFISYYLNSAQGRSRLKLIEIGTTMKHLNVSDMLLFDIPLPQDIQEQKTIAQVLRDADALMESLEKLIEKKRQIKKGAMQELLTGKKRLPGFSGEWQRKVWGDVILSCSSGATPYRGRPDFYDGNIKWITSGELNYREINDTVEHISEDAVNKTNLKTHPKGTFLMAITGLEAAGTRGSCGIVGSPATTNQSCMAVYPSSELLTKYLFHYYIFKGDELALKYCQGTKQQSYTAKLIRILPIELPPTIDEQSVIADTLSDMDAEIDLLEVKLSKAHRIKRGMMQELLTGRIRLI
ncbi:restriction endonuclease subunit S [Methylophilus sp.]|uniref:restriction endonuclease subunit S n=1 Tax=Methylophilus sp. TaxID=29541 RepID=UPI00403684F6